MSLPELHAQLDAFEKALGDDALDQADSLLDGTRNSYFRADDGRLIAAIGIEDMIVVSTADAVLVAHRDRAGDVKDIVERLKADGRQEAMRNKAAAEGSSVDGRPYKGRFCLLRRRSDAGRA